MQEPIISFFTHSWKSHITLDKIINSNTDVSPILFQAAVTQINFAPEDKPFRVEVQFPPGRRLSNESLTVIQSIAT